MPQHRNLAARAGRWSAGHRKTAILGWLAFVIAAFVLGGATGVTHQRDEDLGSGESGRADQIIAAGFADHASEQVLVQSRGTITFDDSRFKRALDDLEARLERFPYVANLSSPVAQSGSLVSADRRSSMVQFDVLGDSTTARERVGPVLAAVAQVQAAHPEFRIEELGDASASEAIVEAFEDDAQRAEFLSLPITLLILVAAFGSLVAAGLPLLLGLTAVVATIGLLGPVSHVIPVAEAITSVVLLVGLAVGVDYSMFYIRRERDERAAGRGNAAALEAAAATSGRAVLISGLTVIVAMSGMFVVGHPVFQSFAVGTIMVVAVAVAGSLTVLPATLAALGDRIDKGRLPLLAPRRDPESGVWAAIVERVLGRPWVAVCTAGALLVVLALPDAAPAHGRRGRPGAPGGPADHADVRPHRARLPGRSAARARGGAHSRGQGVERDPGPPRRASPRAGHRAAARAVRLHPQPGSRGRCRHDGGRRQGHRRDVQPRARRPA